MKRIVIVGATSAIAEQCARLWVRQPVEILLLGRNTERLERVVADLNVRSPQSKIEAMVTDFQNPMVIESIVNSIFAQGSVDLVLIAHGILSDQNACQNDLTQCQETLMVNAISPVLYAEAFAKQMAIVDKGTLALIGSVAGDRGRKSNYVYGSAKGLVARYAQGLQHRFAASGVKVVLIKPGPVDTPMTAHLKNQGARLAPVDQVAKTIVTALKSNKAVVYVPGKWRIIMLVIQHLPAFIFNKINI